MPLKMASALRFPLGITPNLHSNVVDDFLSLIKRISSSNISQQYLYEVFKQQFYKVSGDNYYRSSSQEWAESDMNYSAQIAAKDAPNFIAAIFDALEELNKQGVEVPKETHINQILSKHQVHYQITNGELIETAGSVTPPELEKSLSNTVMRALQDANMLIGSVDASSAIDRAHTALHGYLVQLCNENSIPLPKDPTASKAFKELREHHPALRAAGHRADDISRVLNSFAASIDAFSTLRNKASLAHVNELLDAPEATVIVNAMYTIFRYIQDCITRYNA